MEITGTLVWYYFICKREVWLMGHQIYPDQENDYLEIGRFIDEHSYAREKKEISIGNIKIDRLWREGSQLVIGEVKKSSSYLESATYQLLYYIDTLRKMGIEARGELLFPEEKRREVIEWTEEGQKKLYQALQEIENLLLQPKPPAPVKKRVCHKCAYQEYCWAEE